MKNWTARQREVFVCAFENRELPVIISRLGITRQAVDERLMAFGQTDECLSAGVSLWLTSPSGRPIFPFSPTPAGRAIYPDVKRLVLSETAARKKLASMSDDHLGIVRIGAYSVHLESLLGVLLHDFHHAYPLIAVERAPVSPPESSHELEALLWQPLRSGQLDLVFGGDQHSEFNSHVLYSTAIVAKVPADHEWRKAGYVDAEELVRSRLGVLPPGYFSRDKMEVIFAEHGVRGMQIERPTVRSLEVLQSRGVVPLATDDAIGDMFEHPPLPRVHVDGVPLLWDLAMHWRKSRGSDRTETGAIDRFRRYIIDRSPGYGHHWAKMLGDARNAAHPPLESGARPKPPRAGRQQYQ